jgi:hypothetical protein
MGANASRLGVAFAGPLLLCAALPVAASPRRRRLVLAAAVPLLVWQWWAPARETFKGAVDPSSPHSYRAWLAREGVHYVALPDVPLDPTGRAEAKLIRRGLPFLRRVFSDRHWEVFEVRHTPGLTNASRA